MRLMPNMCRPLAPVSIFIIQLYHKNTKGYGERVPKRVDHEERRRQIADALLRAAATRGLHATGMREVAAEAGVSLRLVQYYFGTKEELLLAAMQQLAVRFGERGMARIRRLKETENPVTPRGIVTAILTEALPADDERRTFTILNAAYFALSLTDPALAIAPLARNSDARLPGPGPGSLRPAGHDPRPELERPRRPALGRAGPSRHRLPPGPRVLRVPGVVLVDF
jgi:AcrR family transcriptional regulator